LANGAGRGTWSDQPLPRATADFDTFPLKVLRVNTSLLRVIVASTQPRPRNTSGNRLHPVLSRTNVGGEPDVTRTSRKSSELANSDIRVVPRALFIFLLFDEMAVIDCSRLRNGQCSKNKRDNAAV
jgi:hypothetical protein